MREARDLRGIFGWSLPFAPDLLPANIHEGLDASGLLETGERLKSKIRVSSIGDNLFAHSAFPTDDEDSVFLGPDSYRFVDFLRAELVRQPGVRRLVDIGAGAGVGAISASALLPGARITLTDVNSVALRYAQANARHAGLNVELLEGSGLDAVEGPFDLAIANPPFIIDSDGRAYRDGGDMHGGRLSIDWALEAARRVEPGGRVLLYTGSAILEGRDELREALERALPSGATLRYRELDPDIFGEELDKPGYKEVERIAAVGAVIETRSP
jgi:methylase of polypeptide subunit release factors